MSARAMPMFRWYGFIPFRYIGKTGGFFGTRWYVGRAGWLQKRKPPRPDMWQDENDDESWEDV